MQMEANELKNCIFLHKNFEKMIWNVTRGQPYMSVC